MFVPGAGRSENDSVARVGTTLKAIPPSSAATLRLIPGNPAGPLPRCAIPISSSATAARASTATGLTRPSTSDEWPPGPPSDTVAAPMPRWRTPTRQPVGSQTMARSSPTAASLAKKASMQVWPCSSSPENRMPTERLGFRRRASTSSTAAMAPLVSAVPRPCRRSPR